MYRLRDANENTPLSHYTNFADVKVRIAVRSFEFPNCIFYNFKLVPLISIALLFGITFSGMKG